MELKSVKLPKKSKKESTDIKCCEVGEQEEYPYNLRICLREEQIKLFPELMNLKVGDKVTISAEANITMIRSTARKEDILDRSVDILDRSVDIQIKSLGLEYKKPLDKMSAKEYRKAREMK